MGRIGIADAREGGFKACGTRPPQPMQSLESLTLAKVVSKPKSNWSSRAARLESLTLAKVVSKLNEIARALEARDWNR